MQDTAWYDGRGVNTKGHASDCKPIRQLLVDFDKAIGRGGLMGSCQRSLAVEREEKGEGRVMIARMAREDGFGERFDHRLTE